MSQDSRHRTWNVAVIGGGIVGICCALELQSRGRTVAVVDRGQPRVRASFGNAGVISRGSILPLAGPAIWPKFLRYAANRDPALKIRYRALPNVAGWLFDFLTRCNATAYAHAARALNPLTAAAFSHHERLATLVGAGDLLKRDGYLKLFRGPDAGVASSLERQLLTEAGVRVSHLNADDIRDLEPFLAPGFTHAMFFPESGSVRDPGRLVEQCWEAFRARGGHTITGEVTAVDCSEASVEIITTERRISAATAVIAAGAWSSKLMARLGYRIPFAAERGYHAHFKLQPGARLNRPILDAEGAYSAAPMAGDEVRLLTGVELARPDDTYDGRQLVTVTGTARTRLPIAEMVAGSQWMGSRPSTADGLPVIGRAPWHPRLLLAFGHGHVGLSTGPITGRIVADLEGGVAPPLPIASFSIERYC